MRFHTSLILSLVLLKDVNARADAPFAPTSVAPATAVPGVSTSPVTDAPVSTSPVGTSETTAPVSGAPASSVPESSAPASSAPASSVPATSSPVSSAPASSVPDSSAPASSGPVSGAPVSGAPVSSAPASSSAPATGSPVMPSSGAPVSTEPVSSGPATVAPDSAAPFIIDPGTAAPFTMAPGTAAPFTVAPVMETPSMSPSGSHLPTTSLSPSETSVLPANLRPRIDRRCGVDELDARGNCKMECSDNPDCPEGEFCWATFSNYCHIMPDGHPYCPNHAAGENTILRCGFDEQAARGYCGKSCADSSECDGAESCFPVQLNFCECFEEQDANATSATRRDLMAGPDGTLTNEEYFELAKEEIAPYFGDSAGAPASAPTGSSAPSRMILGAIVGTIFAATVF